MLPSFVLLVDQHISLRLHELSLLPGPRVDLGGLDFGNVSANVPVGARALDTEKAALLTKKENRKSLAAERWMQKRPKFVEAHCGPFADFALHSEQFLFPVFTDGVILLCKCSVTSRGSKNVSIYLSSCADL